MVAISTIKEGDLLYTVFRTKAGNTKMTRQTCLPVRIIEIQTEPTWRALASTNGNRPQWIFESAARRLRRSPPKSD